MKIALFAAENSIVSGAFRCLVEMAACWQKTGHEVVVILPESGDGETLLRERQLSFAVLKNYGWIVDHRQLRDQVLQWGKRVCNKVMYQRKLKKFLVEGHFDVVHINSAFTYLGGAVALELNLPVVWHLRDFLEEDHNCMFIQPQRAEQLIAQANRIVTVSDAVFAKYARRLPVNKMERVYDGVDPHALITAPRSLYQGKVVNLLLVGRICEKKGQRQVVEALGQLVASETVPSFHVCVAGAGKPEDEAALQEAVRKYRLQERVTLLGVSREVNKLYAAADVVVVNSFQEAFGRVTVEAMLSGCLVVGANGGATPEILADGRGIIFDYADAHSLKQALRQALTATAANQQMAEAGQKYALANLTAEINAARVANILQAAVQEKAEAGGDSDHHG